MTVFGVPCQVIDPALPAIPLDIASRATGYSAPAADALCGLAMDIDGGGLLGWKA